jgi:hypothetical protein
MRENKPLLRVIVRAREDGAGYRYQIFTVGSAEPRPSQSNNVTYATREDAERAGLVAAGWPDAGAAAPSAVPS